MCEVVVVGGASDVLPFPGESATAVTAGAAVIAAAVAATTTIATTAAVVDYYVFVWLWVHSRQGLTL